MVLVGAAYESIHVLTSQPSIQTTLNPLLLTPTVSSALRDQLRQPQILGCGDLEIPLRTRHQANLVAQSFHQRRVIARAFSTSGGMGLNQKLSGKTLRSLCPPQPIPRNGALHRVARKSPALLHGVAEWQGWDGADPGSGRLDHGVNDRSLHEGPCRVVDQHDLARGRQGFQSGSDRSASLGTARYENERAAGERLEPGWRIGGVCRGQRYHDLGNFGMGSERTEGAQQHRDAGNLAILLGDLAAQTFAASCGYDDDANVTRQALAPVVRRDPVRRSRIQGSGRRFVLR